MRETNMGRNGTFANASIAIASMAIAAMIFTTPARAEEGDSYVLPINNITASTVLPAEYDSDYSQWNVFDGESSTAWVEGIDGYGVGEYLEIYTPDGDVITGISILPGYYKNEDIFYKNSAPTSATISSGSESTEVYFSEFANEYRAGEGMPYYRLDTPIVSNGVVRFTITGVREGWKYSDTCISELELWGYESAGQAEESGGAMYDTSGKYHDYELEQMLWLAQDIAKRHSYQLSNLSLANSQLIADDYAFGLYWYQYMREDERIQHSKDGWTNTVSRADAAAILDELFGAGTADRVLDTVLISYAESYDESDIVFNAAGDFGDAGEWFADKIVYRGEENGEVVVSSRILRYNAQTGEYENAGNLEARFDAEPTGYSGYYNNYCFNSLKLTVAE